MKRILIVDDEPRNVKLLAAKLPQKTYDIICAYDGKSALDLVQKEAPDLILLDVVMPGINGYEVIRKLKNGPSTRNIPIILVTALDGPEEKTKGLKAGADDFLNKPVHYAELIARVRSLLRLKEYHEKTETSTGPPQKTSMESPTDTGKKEHENNIPSILYLEGDKKIDALIQDYQDDQKYKINRCCDGKEAISLISQKEMDLLILNVPLPGTDALKLCKRLKELEKTKNIQIMVVTNQKVLESTVKAMEFCADDFMAKPVDADVFKNRIDNLLKKKKDADRLMTNPQAHVSGAINDKVSGLYTRDYFEQQLNIEIRRSMRQRYSLTLMIIHIDILDMDDDSFGDLTRDQIINQYGQVIKKCIREEDFAALFGDKEFAALLPFLDKNNADSIVQRIQNAVSDHDTSPRGSSNKLEVTASLGFACFPSDACTASQLIQNAVAGLQRNQKKYKQG